MKLYFNENLKLTQRDYEEHVEGTENFDKLTVYYPNTLNYDTITVRYYAKTPDGDEIGPFPLTHNANITGYVGRYLEFNDKVLSQTGVVLITIEFAIKRTSTSLMSYKTAASVKMNVLEAHKVSNDITIYDNEENTIYSMKSAIENIEGGLDNHEKHVDSMIKKVSMTQPTGEHFDTWYKNVMKQTFAAEQEDNSEAKIIEFTFTDTDNDSYWYYAFKDVENCFLIFGNNVFLKYYGDSSIEELSAFEYLLYLREILESKESTKHNLNNIRNLYASGEITASELKRYSNSSAQVLLYDDAIDLFKDGGARIRVNADGVNVGGNKINLSGTEIEINAGALKINGGTSEISIGSINTDSVKSKRIKKIINNVEYDVAVKEDETFARPKVSEMGTTSSHLATKGYVDNVAEDHVKGADVSVNTTTGTYTMQFKDASGNVLFQTSWDTPDEYIIDTTKNPITNTEYNPDGTIKSQTTTIYLYGGRSFTIDTTNFALRTGSLDSDAVRIVISNGTIKAEVNSLFQSVIDNEPVRISNENTRNRQEAARERYFDEVKSLLAENYRAGGYKLIEEEGKLILDIKSI